MNQFPNRFLVVILVSLSAGAAAEAQVVCTAVADACDAACQQECARLATEALELDRLRICDVPEPGASYELANADLASVLDFECTVYRSDACDVEIQGTRGFRLCEPNLSVASVLNALDIDGDKIADTSADTDGDGLPDSWEVGGVESNPVGADNPVDRVVFYPSPSAIVPGTPPTPIFARRAVGTDALRPDTDADGLTDFTEVFGLMFIDEDHDGRLDPAREWHDKRRNGLPNPGEYPFDNSGSTIGRAGGVRIGLLHDFDGFVFTDPTNPDTDGDSVNDGADTDPLINLRAFGNQSQVIVRFDQEGVADIDQDGLGNAMDMGNDLVRKDAGSTLDFQVIDNPQDLTELLRLFRSDLLVESRIPESQIEDLLGIDWDGNGLWRTTDVRNWTLIVGDTENPASLPENDFTLRTLFRLDPNDDETRLYADQTFGQLFDLVQGADSGFEPYGGGVARGIAGAGGIGLGWQEVLKPTGPSTRQFIPDDRVWAILYSWRMPGFDIDGDGFVGPPNLSGTRSFRLANPDEPDSNPIASIAFARNTATAGLTLSQSVEVKPADEQDSELINRDLPFDDFITIEERPLEEADPILDGIVQAPDSFLTFPCGGLGFIMLGMTMLGLVAPRALRGGARPR